MPHLRGIELSLVADFGSRALCEYPHPDAASIGLLPTSEVEQDTIGRRSSTKITSVSLKKSNPRVSVYVSSTPEDEFWLRYAINQSPPPSKFIFFKMLINGRHIVSWGIDTTQRTDGTVAKALYQPDQNHTVASGVEQAVNGVESRYFHFLQCMESQSAAEDGGLIEVRIFRCRGRQQIEAELEEYRGQEHYGISSPSGGLLQHPNDTFFYEYQLMDARDSPYATFYFHYRSMKYLEQLNLLPAQEVLNVRLSPVRPTRSAPRRTNTAVTMSRLSGRKYRDSLDLVASPTPRDRKSYSAISRLSDESITAAADTRDDANNYHTPESEAHVRPPFCDFVATAQTEFFRDEHLESSQRSCLVSRKSSRSSSLRSNCPSLTPSLKQYAESIEFQNEHIRLSMAHIFHVSSEGLTLLPISDKSARSFEDIAPSDYESSSSTSGLSAAKQIPSPSTYLTTIGSNSENQIMGGAFLSSPLQYPSRDRGFIDRALNQPADEHAAMKTTQGFTQVQWLRDTSPDDASLTLNLGLRCNTHFNDHNVETTHVRSRHFLVTNESTVQNELCGSPGTEHSAPERTGRDGVRVGPSPPARNWI